MNEKHIHNHPRIENYDNVVGKHYIGKETGQIVARHIYEVDPITGSKKHVSGDEYLQGWGYDPKQRLSADPKDQLEPSVAESTAVIEGSAGVVVPITSARSFQVLEGLNNQHLDDEPEAHELPMAIGYPNLSASSTSEAASDGRDTLYDSLTVFYELDKKPGRTEVPAIEPVSLTPEFGAFNVDEAEGEPIVDQVLETPSPTFIDRSLDKLGQLPQKLKGLKVAMNHFKSKAVEVLAPKAAASANSLVNTSQKLADAWKASRPQRRDSLRKLTRPARRAMAWTNLYSGYAINKVAETLDPNSHEGQSRRKEILLMTLGSTVLSSAVLYKLGLNPFESHDQIAQTLSPDFLPSGSGGPRAQDALNQAVTPPAHNGQEVITHPEVTAPSIDTNVPSSHTATVEAYQVGGGIDGLDKGTVEEMVTRHFKGQFGELPTSSQTLAAEKYIHYKNGLDFNSARELQPGDVLKMPTLPEWILDK